MTRQTEPQRYAPPVEWIDPFTRRRITNARLRRERAAMPAFRLWYFSCDNGEEDIGWIDVLDGDHRELSPDLADYLQLLDNRLRLWRITPDVAAMLNKGLRREVVIEAHDHPGNRPASLTIWVGVQLGSGWTARERATAPARTWGLAGAWS